MNLDFLCKSFCYKSLVGAEISKHQKYHMWVIDVITYVIVMTQIYISMSFTKINGGHNVV